ncbi:MAG: site-specific integrase [Christiangramia sp.]|nr:site-specific integrase [Christiangramia sp.]
MQNPNFHPTITFYLKKSKATEDGRAPIYVRITVDGRRAETSLYRKVPIEEWNTKSNCMGGNTPEAFSVNQQISKVRNQIYAHFQRLSEDDSYVSALQLRDAFLGRDKKQKMVLNIFEDHNKQIEALVGQEYAPGTLERYRTAKKHVTDFIRWEYKVEDLPIQKVDHRFISRFEFYLKSKRKCAHNSTIKYISNFKKIVRIAFANDWIKKDPFLHWKARIKIVDREFLTEPELQTMLEKKFGMERLDQVRDIFVFCCFTGLAYVDVQKLTKNDIVVNIEGNRWIKTKRTKTKTRSNIPLLPIAEYILQKYKSHPGISEGKILPVLSNQKMNGYLKEIGDLCKIKKNLTFHLARHTFATTVTLQNGVPIESVSKMLGHTSVRTTQHYAKILDLKVSEDMEALKKRLTGRI